MGKAKIRPVAFAGIACAAISVLLFDTQCDGRTRAAIVAQSEKFAPAPLLRAAGEEIRIPRTAARRPPSARLATFLSDAPNEDNIPAFSLVTAQSAAAARKYRARNPAGLLVTYFSSLRYDPKYPPGNPNNYTAWMDDHEQDFVHVGDPGMLSGRAQGQGCEWTWLPDARHPSAYRVYDNRGRPLARVDASDNPQYTGRTSAAQAVYVDSVLGGREVWYTSIDNHTGNRAPASCAAGTSQHPAFLRASFSLTPDPHPMYPAPTPLPGATITISGSVDVYGGNAPVLEWLYHPSESAAPASVALVGGPTHWRVPAGVTFQSDNVRWFGSPVLRYCEGASCTDWWTSNQNNRAGWAQYNTHTNILNTCSASENADAIRMLRHIHSLLGSMAFELDDVVDKVARMRPEIFHAQDSAMPTDADTFRCTVQQWPKYAFDTLHPLGIKTIPNGQPGKVAVAGDGRIFEDVPWSSGLRGPYPFTLDAWTEAMQAILDDLSAGHIDWMIPTGDHAATAEGARIREYSFAVYELLNPYPMNSTSGLYYGFSQIGESVFPEMFVDLGRPRIARPRRLSDLFNAADGMYERQYANGTVYVCPPGGSCNAISTARPAFVARASILDITRGGAGAYVPVDGLTLYPAQGAIVVRTP